LISYLVAVTLAGDRAANLGLCSALRAFEQGGIFIVPHLLRHGTSVYTAHFTMLYNIVISECDAKIGVIPLKVQYNIVGISDTGLYILIDI
jgi:hypothetical protein